MYQRMVDQGISSNRMLGETTREKVADKMVEAILRDKPEVVESGSPVRPLLAMGQLSPRLSERLVDRFGANAIFRRLAEQRGPVD
jgi:hypothetical protein